MPRLFATTWLMTSCAFFATAQVKPMALEAVEGGLTGNLVSLPQAFAVTAANPVPPTDCRRRG